MTEKEALAIEKEIGYVRKYWSESLPEATFLIENDCQLISLDKNEETGKLEFKFFCNKRLMKLVSEYWRSIGAKSLEVV